MERFGWNGRGFGIIIGLSENGCCLIIGLGTRGCFFGDTRVISFAVEGEKIAVGFNCKVGTCVCKLKLVIVGVAFFFLSTKSRAFANL